MAFYVRNLYGQFWGKYISKYVPFTEEFVWNSRASIFDVDQFLHINNAMYLRLCEYSRWAWASCAHMIDFWKKKRCYPVISLLSIRYRRPITLFTKYCIKSRIVHVAEHSFYITHKFYVKDELMCSVLIELRIVSAKGQLNCIDLFHEFTGAESIPSVDTDQYLKQGIDLFHALEAVLLEKPLSELHVTPASMATPTDPVPAQHETNDDKPKEA